MAATQAEAQLNERNREHERFHHNERPQHLENVSLHNGGTEKNGGDIRSVNDIGSHNSDQIKSKISGHNNCSMDQYSNRQEPSSGGGSSVHNNDPNNVNNEDVNGKSDKMYSQNSDQTNSAEHYNKQNPQENPAHSSYGMHYSLRGSFGGHVDHNLQLGNCSDSNSNSASQFNMQHQVRQSYPNSKSMSPALRPPHPGSGTNAAHGGCGFMPHNHPQTRFMSGQSISQQMGPTPTLNQLLQSSNPVHRYQNNYAEYTAQKPNDPAQTGMPFNHGWNSRPMGPYMNTPNQQSHPPYRNQLMNAPQGNHPRCGPPNSAYPLPQQQPPQSQQPPCSTATTPPISSASIGGSNSSGYSSHPQSPSPSQPTQSLPVGPQHHPPPPTQQQQQDNSQQYHPSYQQQQRYPTPQQPTPVRVPAYAAPHHQLNPPYGGPVPQQQLYPGDQRAPPWSPSQSPQSQTPPQIPPQQQHLPPNSPAPPNSSSNSNTPQPSSAHQQPHSPISSPQPVNHPESSPQQQQHHQPHQSPHHQPHQSPHHQPHQSPQHQSQSLSYNLGRPPHSSITPEPGDLTSQNSNDSSSGGPQAMRPTPSPTGSTGSRSMSPAVGQPNIPMPPRPPSGQSDSGSTSSQSRMSHSPMATQSGYQQQPLAPPSHMHNYKMGAGGPPGSMHPSMIQNPVAGSPYPTQMPPSHQQYPPQPGTYGGRNMPPGGMPMYQNYALQQPGGNQYPARPMPNHIPHSQFPNYQGWGSPNMTAPVPGPSPLTGVNSPNANHVPTSQSLSGGKVVPPPSSSPQHLVPSSVSSLASSSAGSQQQQPPHHVLHHHPAPPPQQHQQLPPSPQQSLGPPPPQQQHQQTQSQSPHSQQAPPPQQQQQPSQLGGPNTSPGPRGHNPQYLKQQLQHKVGGFGSSNNSMPPSPGPPPGMYGSNSPSPGMGPPSHHHPMGPPLHGGGGHHLPAGMGPPMSNMVPPLSGPMSNSHHDGPMPPPTSNSHLLSMHQMHESSMENIMHDTGSGLMTTASGNMTNVSQINSGGITSVVTTGPDGTSVDEASQQSTLSNTSAASGEDPSTTPKRKDPVIGMLGAMGGYLGGHAGGVHMPGGNQMPPCSPGMNSLHDEYSPVDNSPPWSRTPNSPVYNSHMPQDIYRSKKHDSLGKLYEMDDHPERRMWMDKLLQFMEERGTPITTCPTISKHPLDLFRLYVYVKERGGFVEVMKNKVWKDVAGLLSIGASSSAAYTLRKHYTKHLLPFECHFDRGGIDPQPIINQLETSTKKKGPKAAPVPSPGGGSSNSQDSFPSGPGGPGPGMDGYNYGYPPEYANQRGPPPMHNSQGIPPQSGPYANQSGYSQYPSDQYGQQYMPPNAYLPQSRPMYPIYPPDAERGYSQSNNTIPPGGHQQQQMPSLQPSLPGGQDPYSRSPYGGGGGHVQPIYHPRPTFTGPPHQQQQQQQAPPTSSSSNQQQQQSLSPSSTAPPPQVAAPPSPTPVSQPSQSYSPSLQQQQQQQQQQQHQLQGPAPLSQQQPPQIPPASQPLHSPHVVEQPPQQSPQLITGPPPPQQAPQAQPQPPMQHQQPSPQQSQSPQQPPPHEYYRTDQGYSNQNQIPPQQGAATFPMASGSNKGMPPPSGQPRRHPDFSKDQQPPSPYPTYNNQQRPAYSGWSPNNNNNNNNQFRGIYPPNGPPSNIPPAPQQWNQGQVLRPQMPPNSPQPPPPSASQWDQRYPPNSPMPFPQSQPSPSNQWNMGPVPGPAMSPSPRSPRANFRPDVKPPFTHGQLTKGSQQIIPTTAQQQTSSFSPATVTVKKELNFPPDSVEAVTPLLYKRRKLARTDVAPVDAWKLVMSLRSGLLGETCWALDVLNILCFDDVAIQYFGLSHMPGLLDILLEHFNRSLEDMLVEKENNSDDYDVSVNKKWYENSNPDPIEPDLGQIRQPPDPNCRYPLKSNLPDYTLKSRRGTPVGVLEPEENIFVSDAKRDWDNNICSLEDVIKPDTKYLVPCLKSDLGGVPFVRLLPEFDKNKNNINNNKCDNKNNNNGIIDNNKNNPDEDVEKNNKIPTKDKNENQKGNNGNKIIKIEKNNCPVKNEPYDEDVPVINKSEPNCEPLEKSGTVVKCEPSSSSVDAAVIIKSENNEEEKMEVVEQQEQKIKKEEENVDEDDNAEEMTDVVERKLKEMNCNLKDPVGVLRKRRLEQYEDECYTRDEASLYLVTDTQDSIARRCITISTIIRNLTFVPGNELEFARNPAFLILMGKLLLIHHEHPLRTRKQQNYDREEDSDFTDCCSSLQQSGESSEWWWEFLYHIRENVLVAITNISGCTDLSGFTEEVSRPILDGLLHWAVCPAAQGQDCFPTASNLSPQRLALEALCKLCVSNGNVDLVIATPPYSRLEKLTNVLTKLLCRSEEQVLREFAVNLLHYLAAADSSMSRIIALQSPCISLLVAFIEQADQSALGVANQHGINTLRDNPELMGTSLDMLRRAARTLLHLSKHPDNKSLFLQQEQRLLALVMSQILDQQVASVIAQVLYQCSRSTPPPNYYTNNNNR